VNRLLADEDVRVAGVRPGDAPVVEPEAQCPIAEVAESLATAAEDDSAVGEVDFVECQVPDGSGAGRVLGGQGDDDSFGRSRGQLLDSVDLHVAHRKQNEVDRPGLEPDRRVGEDQTAFLGEPEQRPQRFGRICAHGAAQRPEASDDVGPVSTKPGCWIWTTCGGSWAGSGN
jgi:hypothetical protein